MRLYNTLTREVEEFKPRHDKKVHFFVCGPTVYDLAQLGNSKTYIQMDILARTLKTLGYNVFYLQNITDVDDKIIARAAERNLDWKMLAKQYEEEYLKDMQWLGNDSVTEYARATDYINQIINQVQRLLDLGHAYIINGDGIYFEISTFADYGKLSKRDKVQEDDAESRIDQSENKRGWNDFALWKFSKPGEPTWDAPFGEGRPGWHIEDTAITEHFFGPQYDIHGGAVDLIFPHHEAELTQMESVSGKIPFVGYWAHVGFLTVDGARMGKSKGNFITIREVAEKGYDPSALRIMMLQSHYRSPVNFTWDLLDAATNRLRNWQAMADLRWQTHSGGVLQATDLEAVKTDILEILQSDLNTPEALARLSKLESTIDNGGINVACQAAYLAFLQWLDGLFGLSLSVSQDISDNQKQIIIKRKQARKTQDWAESDRLRNELLEQGIGVRDTADNTIWYRV